MQLNVMKWQSRSRVYRACFNSISLLLVLIPVTNELALVNNVSHMSASSVTRFNITFGILHFVFVLIQPVVYAYVHPIFAGFDQISPGKLASQAQITAVTGVGYFLSNEKGKEDEIDPKKLDKVLEGPMETRLSFFAAILKFDRSVYQTAIFADLLGGSTGVEEAIYGDSYKQQVEEFSKLKPSNVAERRAIVDMYVRQKYAFGPADMDQISRIYENLELYELNELHIQYAEEKKITELLDDRSKLCSLAKRLLLLSLNSGYKINCNEIRSAPELEADRQLVIRKGHCESQVDIASSYQAAQKIGQAFSFFIGGSYSMSILKVIASVANLIICIIVLKHIGSNSVSPSLLIAAKLALLQTNITIWSIAFLGTLFAATIAAYAYHQHIVIKASQRSAGSSDMPMPNRPSATQADLFGVWYFPSGNELTIFKTLAATPPVGSGYFASDDKNVWEIKQRSPCVIKPLKYKKPEAFIRNVLQQFFAYDPIRVNIFASIPYGELVRPSSLNDEGQHQQLTMSISQDSTIPTE